MPPAEPTARHAVHVFHYPVFGGPQNEVLRLARPLAERGWTTSALLPAEPGNAAERLRGGGVEVDRLPYRRARARPDPRVQLPFAAGFAADVVRMRRLIRRRRADLVVAVGVVNPQAALAARLEGVPVVWKVVDTLAPLGLTRALMPVVRRLAAVVMFTGDALLEAHGGRRSGMEAVVYYPPVDTERFSPSADRGLATRRDLGLPPDAPVVGTVANITPQKGLEQFVATASLVHAREPRAHFLVVGAAFATHRDYLARLRAAIDRSGIPREQFVLPGYRDDPERYYPAMDLKLLTAMPRSEGVTTAALEAMACGVPVVTVDVAALKEAVEDGVTGAVVAPLDARAAADAVLRLLGDPALRKRMAAVARRRAVERFGLEACAETHIEAFEAAMERHAGSSLRRARRRV